MIFVKHLHTFYTVLDLIYEVYVEFLWVYMCLYLWKS